MFALTWSGKGGKVKSSSSTDVERPNEVWESGMLTIVRTAFHSAMVGC